MTGYSTLDTLIAALDVHLTEHPLPQPVSVLLNVLTPGIDVQVSLRGTLAQLSELLAWGRSLHQVSVRWWRTLDGKLHVTLTGRTTAGVRFKAYGSVGYGEVAGLVSLAPDESADVSLDALAWLVTRVASTVVGAA